MYVESFLPVSLILFRKAWCIFMRDNGQDVFQVFIFYDFVGMLNNHRWNMILWQINRRTGFGPKKEKKIKCARDAAPRAFGRVHDRPSRWRHKLIRSSLTIISHTIATEWVRLTPPPRSGRNFMKKHFTKTNFDFSTAKATVQIELKHDHFIAVAPHIIWQPKSMAFLRHVSFFPSGCQ